MADVLWCGWRVIGPGLALQFKKAFPKTFVLYERACKVGEVVTGRMHIVKRHGYRLMTSPSLATAICEPAASKWSA